MQSITESIRIAITALSANKMRAFLTILMIIIGITMVTLMNTISNGIDGEFEKSMSMLGQNVLYVEKAPWGGGPDYKWWEFRNRRRIRAEYVQQIEEIGGLHEAVSASIGRGVSLRYGKNSISGVFLAGVTDGYFETAGLNLENGRIFSGSDIQRGAKVAVIGAGIQEKLFDEDIPLDKYVRMDGQKYLVIGVLEKQGKFLGLAETDNRIIIPITSYRYQYGSWQTAQIAVKYPSEEIMEEGEYELEGVMRRVRGLDAAEKNDFDISSPKAFEDQLNSFKAVLYLIGGGLTALSLIIGGIGIMNIMLVSVRERTKEIGIRKAVGARSWEILLQFLVEAVVLSMIGGVIGIVIAGGLSIFINTFFIAVMDIGVVFLAVALCSIVGISFGFFPALKAAKSDPIESLRFE